MIATLASAAVIVWASVAIAAAVTIGKAIRLADAALDVVADYTQDPDGRPLHVSQMTFVPAEWAVTE